MAESVAAEAPADTRILIDVSGSMKRTDPNNLRMSAVRMLTGLLPAGTRAGVWTFGRYVNMEVKHGAVDDDWRARARAGAGRIHSRAMHTNIEGAIERSTRGWRSAPAGPRNLIVLTDGVVDVSKDSARNQASRERILTELLPGLQERGIKVLTVALSDEADQELLETLALATQGWFVSATSADKLQRAFLSVFEQSNDTDAIPLSGDTFQVDASIDEMTLLVFRPPAAEPARLITPGGTVVSAANASAHGINWLSDEGYDLITAAEPAMGEWRIDSELDPDNRVLVVTDLRLRTGEVPARLMPGESLSLVAELEEAGRPIERDDFLNLVQVVAEHVAPDGRVRTLPLRRRGSRFSVELDTALEGEHVIALSAASDTFAREEQFRFNVILPVEMSLGGADEGYPLRVAPRSTFFAPDSFEVRAQLVSEDGVAAPVTLAAAPGGDWLGDLGEIESGVHQLHVHVSGSAPTGAAVAFELPPVEVRSSAPPVPATAPSVDEPAEAPQAFEWLTLAWQVGAVNGGLALIAAGVWWWRRRGGEDEDLMLAEVEA